MSKEASLFVIAAPSGAGKTTLVNALVERNPALKFSISYTTRPMRATEKDGRDYFFVDYAEFDRLRQEGELLESAVVFDNHYGTSRSQVEAHLANGDDVILEIDWQGAEQVRVSMPGCVTIFIMPPARDELERRLRGRRTDSDEVIARRLRDALGDMSHWSDFDYVIINDDLDQAVEEIEGVIVGEADHCRTDNHALAARIQKILA